MHIFIKYIAAICNILNKLAFWKQNAKLPSGECHTEGASPQPDVQSQQGETPQPNAQPQQGETPQPNAQPQQGETPQPNAQPQQGETSQPNAQPQQGETSQTTISSEPVVRPGRRKPNNNNCKKDTTSPPKACGNNRPNIICQKISEGWLIALEPNDITSAIQGDIKLEMINNRYPLQRIADITFTKDGAEETIPLDRTKPLVFQTSKNWKGKKRLVKHVSPRFCYVVCAPACCGKRKNPQPRIAPENTIYEGFQMHFFASDEELVSDGFEHCSDFIAPREFYHLDGRIIADHSDKGDLFAEIPVLTDGGKSGFSDISVHVGEEGRSGWVEEIDPSAKQIADVLKNRAGWFFLRVYRSGELIVSADFRYLPGLDGIIVAGNENWESVPIIPASDGHAPTSIEFIGDGICAASENIGGFAGNIPAGADFDATEWTVKNSANQEVKVSIALPRVWWRTHKNQKSEEWMSTPIELDRIFLKNATRADGGVEIRVPDFTRKIQVGFFADDNDRLDIAKGKGALGKFLYTDFSDDEKIENAIEKDLFLWGCLDGGERFKIARISADMPPPAPEPEPPQPPAAQPLVPPVPWVMGVHRKWRRGKGFSVKELRDSGCGKVNVAIDKRRKSCYSCNIDALSKLSDTSN